MEIRQIVLLLAIGGLLLGGVGMAQADERPDCADRWTPADPGPDDTVGTIYDGTDNCAHTWQSATAKQTGNAPATTGGTP
ncbi:hypothetical protein [Natrinema sp. 1APR25-10V2]|uniref:hypothetical protein n=1 Tax=Natrinema sp. 1APR25-10V2 TaxID=2951081 RepID=UPI00287BC787|nr:hypothetical protein [Natrinema sp. 1APR25-10V2]